MGISNMSREFIWQYNQDFDRRRKTNKLKWGIHTAEITNTNGVVQISFYCYGTLVKSYAKEMKPSVEWITRHIYKYFNSVHLDREMYGAPTENKFHSVDQKYRIYADN
jgi:hypothetical protein